MKDSNFAYYTILATAASLVMLMFSSLSEDPYLKTDIADPYEISCQHPAGHVVKYKVSRNKNIRHYFKGSNWFFKTTTGEQVASTFCHLEVE